MKVLVNTINTPAAVKQIETIINRCEAAKRRDPSRFVAEPVRATYPHSKNKPITGSEVVSVAAVAAAEGVEWAIMGDIDTPTGWVHVTHGGWTCIQKVEEGYLLVIYIFDVDGYSPLRADGIEVWVKDGGVDDEGEPTGQYQSTPLLDELLS